jgi:hypothetical protein
MLKSRPGPVEAPRYPLPPDRAFVVQFRPSTGSGPAPFTGRIEHIASGTAGPFGSVDELVGFVTRVLATAAVEHDPDASPLVRGGS